MLCHSFAIHGSVLPHHTGLARNEGFGTTFSRTVDSRVFSQRLHLKGRLGLDFLLLLCLYFRVIWRRRDTGRNGFEPAV